MSQRREPWYTGPYKDKRSDGRPGYRCVVKDGEGSRSSVKAATAEEAVALAEETIRLLRQQEEVDLEEALRRYKAHQIGKGNLPRSVETTQRRLKSFLGPLNRQVRLLTPFWGKERYAARREAVAVDTHRNELSEAKTFLLWCVGEGWCRANPLAEVKGEGRRDPGKDQLRLDEARLWRTKAYELAEAGDDGAVAALMALELGMRAEEITNRTVRDVDDDGRLLWTESKTAAGKRTLEVRDRLRVLLLEICRGKLPSAPLFPAAQTGRHKSKSGLHWRDWPRENVRRICQLAGVPVVTAHGMRGLSATLALLDGRNLREVADRLGHDDETTTKRSYLPPGVVETAQQRAALRVLEGGRR